MEQMKYNISTPELKDLETQVSSPEFCCGPFFGGLAFFGNGGGGGKVKDVKRRKMMEILERDTVDGRNPAPVDRCQSYIRMLQV